MDSKPNAYKRQQDYESNSDSSVSKKMKMNDHDVITDDSNQSQQVLCNNNDRTDDNASRRRREKRLAMNRNSARNRRMKTKVLIEVLQNEVNEIEKSKIALQFENDATRARIQKAEHDLNEANTTIASLLSLNKRSNGDYGLNASSYLNSNMSLSNNSLLGNRTTSPNYGSVNRSFVQDHHHPSSFKNSNGALIDEVLKSINPYDPPSNDISNAIMREPRDSVQMFMNQNELSSHRAAAYPRGSCLINMSDQDIAATTASRAVSYESILRSESDKQIFQESQRQQVMINDLLAQQVQENLIAKQLRENLIAKQMQESLMVKQMQENLIAKQIQENTENILKRMG